MRSLTRSELPKEGKKMEANLQMMYLLTKLEAEAVEADKDLAEKQATEEANDFGDAMESMERSYAEGFSDALEMAIRILKEGK
jgi:hypothetical protein